MFLDLPIEPSNKQHDDICEVRHSNGCGGSGQEYATPQMHVMTSLDEGVHFGVGVFLGRPFTSPEPTNLGLSDRPPGDQGGSESQQFGSLT